MQILRDRDLLESIDPTTDLRNWGNVDPSFRSPAFDPGSGLRQRKGKPPEQKYTVPYQWGTTGIAYDAAEVTGFTPHHLGRPGAVPRRTARLRWSTTTATCWAPALIAHGYDKNDSDQAAAGQGRRLVSKRSGPCR